MIVGLSWEGQGHLKTLWTLCLGQTNPRSRHTAGVTPQAGVLLAGEWWALVACLVTQVRCGGAPGQHLAPSGRGVSHPSPCVSSWGCPHTSPGVFNGPRLGRMKGTIQRRFTIDTSIVLKYASRVTFDPPQLSLHYTTLLFKPLRGENILASSFFFLLNQHFTKNTSKTDALSKVQRPFTVICDQRQTQTVRPGKEKLTDPMNRPSMRHWKYTWALNNLNWIIYVAIIRYLLDSDNHFSARWSKWLSLKH